MTTILTMRQKVTDYVHFLLLLVWLFATFSNGLVVLCLEHYAQPQLELAHQTDCRSMHVDEHLPCESDTHETCLKQQHCKDIPITLDRVVASNIARQYKAIRLAVMPTHFNRIASDALIIGGGVFSPVPRHEPVCPLDPATATGSVVLVI